MKENNNSAKEKILLLTDIPPCKNYTGGLMTSQMIRFLLEEKKDVVCFCAKSKYVLPEFWEDINNDIEMIIVDRPEENVNDADFTNYYSQIKKIKKQLLKYIKQKNITKIWCPVQGEVLIMLLNAIYKNLKIPYVVQIWDPIEWWMKEHYFDNKRMNKTIEEYREMLENSTACITTSMAMSKHYNEKYNLNCIEVMPSLEQYEKFDVETKDNSIFTIALSGQIYAKEEMDLLLTALDKMNWQYNGKEIFFEHYGLWSDSYIDKSKHKKYYDRIIKNGFLNQKELVKKLSVVDLLYCPYFFSTEESLKKVSTLSFPSKLITYLSLQVPTLLHAPNYSAPYMFLKDTKAAYLLDTTKIDLIVEKIKNIIDEKNTEELLKNAKELFEKNFTISAMKENFFKALNIDYSNNKKLNILEVNNVDLPGRRFNGFDLLKEINENSIHRAKQIVTYKTSVNDNVVKFYNYNKQLAKEWNLLDNERNILSVHSQLSLTSDILKNSDYFKNSDLVHYHLIHNTKLSLNSLVDLCSNKPSIWTIHDPWTFTGRCVYPQECEKWKTGCCECEHLENLFSLPEDNCNSLWKLKEKVYNKLDIDIIVSTPFMLEMIKNSPLTKNFKNVHLIPFGLDLNKFNNKISKGEARKKLGINQNDIVLFFRAQLAMKGTEYIVEALKMLETDKKITLLSCSEVGLLDELKDKYTIKDLGDIQDEEMILAYNACDIFLMPSKGESFGLMAIEAMASSRPIIVFNNSALPSVTFAPECGVLVENKNSYKLMEAIRDLINNEEERIRRGKLGRKLAEEHYDINTYHRRILEVYESAYNRQKNKKEFIRDNFIDYNLKDTQILLRKLNLIYNNLFPNKKTPSFLYTKDLELEEFDLNYKIDYSLDSIQNLLTMFNNSLYQNIQELKENFIDIESLSKYNKFKYLYYHDRHELIYRITRHLSKYKFTYRVLRRIYRILRKIKHIFYKNKYKQLEDRINYLEQQLYNINEKIKKL